MKAIALLLSAVAAFALTTAATGSTIIIDGTAPGYVNDGSFELTEANTPWRGAGSSLATNLSIENTIILRKTSPADGTQYTVVGTLQDGKSYGIYLDTGYDLVLGDTFDFSFEHAKHGTTNPQNIAWQLFTTTTGDDNGIVEDVLASGDVTGNSSTTTTKNETFTGIGSVGAASAGERLFIAFTTAGNASNTYSLLDEVNLTAIPVPEPSSLALMGLGGLLIARRRR